MKMQPKEEFPLKAVLKSLCCGGNMIAGWSKGKRKHYLHCRSIKHNAVNISGKLVHVQFNNLLECLSFGEEQVKVMTDRVTEV